MFTTTTFRQFAALTLSAVATLAVLGSIDRLATEPAPKSMIAAAATTPVQVVVIEGKRIARS